MAKTRSPNYPSMPLDEAIELVRPVFKNENRNKMSRKVLAKHLGYNSLSGRALAKIGAVRAYGLIEGSGDAVRVSDDAIAILSAPAGAPERQQALDACALRPPLFKELRSESPDTHPSLENLRFQLVQRNYTEDAAEKAAENYLATMRHVSGESGEYDSSEMGQEHRNLAQQQTAEHSQPPPPPPPPPKGGTNRAEFPLMEGVARLDFPSTLSPESYEELEAWLELVLRRAKRSVKD